MKTHIHIIWKTTSETNGKIENIGVSYATSSFYIAGNTPFFKKNFFLMQQIKSIVILMSS